MTFSGDPYRGEIVLPSDPRGDLLGGSAVAVSRLPESNVSGEFKWNATAYIQDNLWLHGTTEYAAWVDGNKSTVVGKRTLPDGVWSTYDLSTVAGNPLSNPHSNDNHNTVSVATDADGHLHVAGNHHHDPLRYVVSDNPADITSWSAGAMVGTEESSVTYPTFVKMADGTLLFFYRDGVSGDGDLYLNRYSTASGTWSRVGKIIDGKVDSLSPYWQRIVLDGDDNLHIIWTWRDTGSPDSNREVCYAKSTDGGTTWEQSDGTSYTLPITLSTAENAVDTSDFGFGIINQGGADVDANGKIHAAWQRDQSGALSLYYVTNASGAWVAREYTPADQTISRPAVAVLDDGRVWVIYRAADTATYGSLLALDVTDPDNTNEVELFRFGFDEWEPSLSSSHLRDRNELAFIMSRIGTNVPHYRLSSGAVVTIDPTQVST